MYLVYKMSSFHLISEPINNTKPEILFYQILKISYDDGSLTKEIIENPILLEEYKEKIYKQFELEDVKYVGTVPPVKVDHKSNDLHIQCLCTSLGLQTDFIIKNLDFSIDNVELSKKTSFVPSIKKLIVFFLSRWA